MTLDVNCWGRARSGPSQLAISFALMSVACGDDSGAGSSGAGGADGSAGNGASPGGGTGGTGGVGGTGGAGGAGGASGAGGEIGGTGGAGGGTHIPAPNGEEQQISIPWFLWKLLGDQQVCEFFKVIPSNDTTWIVVASQNEAPCN